MSRMRKRKRKPGRSVLIRLPVIDPAGIVRRLIMAAGAAIALYALYALVDVPVRSITVEAPFQRVSAMQVEATVHERLAGGFLSADLGAVRQAVAELQWVDRVRVRRRWPARLHVTLSEQVAAARWREAGLLNVRGELFIEKTRHLPAELPRLEGPDGSEWQVAQRYQQLNRRLLEAGLQVTRVRLDERGAWRAWLAGGIEIRIGRDDTDERIERFLDIVTPLIAPRLHTLRFVDLRYSNGFTLAWHEPDVPVVEEDGEIHAAAGG